MEKFKDIHSNMFFKEKEKIQFDLETFKNFIESAIKIKGMKIDNEDKKNIDSCS